MQCTEFNTNFNVSDLHLCNSNNNEYLIQQNRRGLIVAVQILQLLLYQ